MSANYSQQKWDMLLMRGWQLEKSIGWVVQNFFDEDFCGDKLKSLVELGVKRSFHMKSKNSHAIGYKVPVRAYIDTYCKQLSDRLWNGEPSVSFIFSLDDFRWSNLNCKIKSNSDNVRNKVNRNRRRTRHLALCGGDVNESNSGWGVVK